MSDTHKTKPWYVQLAVENGKKVKPGFKQRRNKPIDLEVVKEKGRIVAHQEDEAAEIEELGGASGHYWSHAWNKRFAKGKNNTQNRKIQTNKKRRKVKDQIKHEDFDAIDNRGTERHDADWYD